MEDVFSASWVNWMQFNLEEGSEDVVKGLGLVVEVDDEEGEGEGYDDYDDYDDFDDHDGHDHDDDNIDDHDDHDHDDFDGYPAHSHHDKFPPWWDFVRGDDGGNLSVTKSHH